MDEGLIEMTQRRKMSTSIFGANAMVLVRAGGVAMVTEISRNRRQRGIGTGDWRLCSSNDTMVVIYLTRLKMVGVY
jgi:hypothetical protein